MVKVFLHESKDAQRKRLQARVDDPEKRWKFRLGDLDDRAKWDEFQTAYEDVIRETSTDYAPWYVVPADHNWSRNLCVAEILVDALERLDPQIPPAEPGVDGLVDRLRTVIHVNDGAGVPSRGARDARTGAEARRQRDVCHAGAPGQPAAGADVHVDLPRHAGSFARARGHHASPPCRERHVAVAAEAARAADRWASASSSRSREARADRRPRWRGSSSRTRATAASSRSQRCGRTARESASRRMAARSPT